MRRRRIIGPGFPYLATPITAAAPAGCPAATAFLARTSGLDANHQTYFTTLICDMVSAGLLNSDGTSSIFDVLYIFATQGSANSLLNVINNGSYNATNSGIPSGNFTTDRGWTGDAGAHNLNSNYNPGATSPAFVGNYAQNSAHISVWNLSNTTEAANVVYAGTGQNLFPNFTGADFYARVNDSPESGALTIGDCRGHLLGNRDSGVTPARTAYRNATSLGTYGTVASQTVNDLNWTLINDSRQYAMMSFGAKLTPTQVTTFYNLLRTFMTSVGVP